MEDHIARESSRSSSDVPTSAGEAPSLTYQQVQDRLNHRMMEVIEELNDLVVLQAHHMKDLHERVEYLECRIHESLDY